MSPRNTPRSVVSTVIGSDGDGGADEHYINFGSIDKEEAADAVDTDDYDSDYSYAEERMNRLYNTSGSGAADKDNDNIPYNFCGTPARTRGGKPPLSPKVRAANSTVLKRLSRAASKYGISLNLNLNLNATRFRVHQAGNREYEENVFKKTNEEKSDCHTDSYGSSEQGSVAGDDCHAVRHSGYHTPAQILTQSRTSQETCLSDLESYSTCTKDFSVKSMSSIGYPSRLRVVITDDRSEHDTDFTHKKTNESKESSVPQRETVAEPTISTSPQQMRIISPRIAHEFR